MVNIRLHFNCQVKFLRKEGRDIYDKFKIYLKKQKKNIIIVESFFLFVERKSNKFEKSRNMKKKSISQSSL